jgi:hypothetical protein
MNAARRYARRRGSGPDRAADSPRGISQALNVVVVYQDSLTRHWATALWDRLGQLIDTGGICRKSWKLSGLTNAGAFARAVQAAVLADVLVISVRDAGELPMLLHVWADAWLPQRAGRAGALVALIGVPSTPDVLAGRAHEYLEDIARRAGLDFLPRERMLPQEPVTRPIGFSLVAAA